MFVCFKITKPSEKKGKTMQVMDHSSYRDSWSSDNGWGIENQNQSVGQGVSHKASGWSFRFRLNALVNKAINAMVYPLNIGSISWALDFAIRYCELVGDTAAWVQLGASYGIVVGLFALKVTALAIVSRLLIGLGSDLFGSNLCEQGQQQTNGLRRAMKGVVVPFIFAGGLRLGGGAVAIAKVCIARPKLLAYALFAVLCLPILAKIMCMTVLVAAGAGYWVDSKLGLGIGAFCYKQYTKVFAERGSHRPHRSHEFHCEKNASLSEKAAYNKINGFISVLSDTLSELGGGVTDAIMPGR